MYRGRGYVGNRCTFLSISVLPSLNLKLSKKVLIKNMCQWKKTEGSPRKSMFYIWSLPKHTAKTPGRQVFILCIREDGLVTFLSAIFFEIKNTFSPIWKVLLSFSLSFYYSTFQLPISSDFLYSFFLGLLRFPINTLQTWIKLISTSKGLNCAICKIRIILALRVELRWCWLLLSEIFYKLKIHVYFIIQVN